METQEFETKDGKKIIINNNHEDGCADQLVKGCGVLTIIIVVIIALSFLGIISLF